MFTKKETKEEVSFEKFDTLIGKNSAFEGTLKAEGTLRIDGEIKGHLIVKGDVFIGENCKILGDITTTNVVIAGAVEGNVKATNLLRVTSGGKLYGDVEVKSFVVDEEAVFEGNCKMKTQENGKEEMKKTKAKENA
ncbi:polymer-forming cytoskeletal protein [Serpentinicella sp. ANB-PHB4]|uniref:bactofilin family protein n=1 Tax=Serpentinicella sp. ANB-PHB4 TaxID=3074076 RepID=UPI00285EC552|nr:polymer-forming cytoskeletal protein [Serpentinicella sp. ANB-PHB4]MDR5659644.1 polymer-forming cytoskeletal protein [Serpentinicella sp. ANB-PHB4]